MYKQHRHIVYILAIKNEMKQTKRKKVMYTKNAYVQTKSSARRKKVMYTKFVHSTYKQNPPQDKIKVWIRSTTRALSHQHVGLSLQGMRCHLLLMCTMPARVGRIPNWTRLARCCVSDSHPPLSGSPYTQYFTQVVVIFNVVVMKQHIQRSLSARRKSMLFRYKSTVIHIKLQGVSASKKSPEWKPKSSSSSK